jgi:hypothetical protein
MQIMPLKLSPSGYRFIHGKLFFFATLFVCFILSISFYNSPPPDGEKLAKSYCSSCHLFPEPNLLDKKTWKDKVLPNMGWRLGIRQKGVNPFSDMEEQEAKLVKELNVFPEFPMISKENWNLILAYYEANAPLLPLQNKTSPVINNSLTLFSPKALYIGDKKSPKTSLVKYDSILSRLYIADVNNELYVIDEKFELMHTWVVPSPAVDLELSSSGQHKLLCIGSMAPSEKRAGSLLLLDSNEGPVEVLMQGLRRPVQITKADFNNDGQDDEAIAEFGNYTGKLSWYSHGKQDQEQRLRLRPGNRMTEWVDINEDGLKDLVLLSAQALEGISVYLNKSQGRFEEKQLLQFPAVHGSSSFQIVDFNKDGHLDLLMTNGDNWDLSPITKSYHGVRIFLNDGKMNFKESFFFPYPGASKAVAADFDLDGDLDIAAISFYEDLPHPEQGFVLLENKGALQFEAKSLQAAANGKWLTMEVADIDKDGDTDVVLGSYFQNVVEMSKLLVKGVEKFPQVLVLRNTTK